MKSLSNISDWLDIQEHQKIGEILMQCGKLNLIHLGMAFDVQKFEDMQLGEILSNMKVITKKELVLALGLQERIDKIIRIGAGNEF